MQHRDTRRCSLKAIVAFSFGRIGKTQPSLSSREIARMVASYVRGDQEGCYVIAQWEVAIELRSLGAQVHYTVPLKERGYLSSRDVADAAAGFLSARRHLVSQVYAAAHPDHVERCIRCLRNARFPGAKGMTDPSIGYHFDADEWWVRSRSSFTFRERLAIPAYLWRRELF
ncbi:MAG: hypothetical protein A2845_03015 [Candidatus Lloydbacteria bacterium RIFCSPHIGHO2_01_FULL_49_22]|uniref:Uncharacterized protein n=1 Tax=Candidatus Lloydbacteria bacterium RIFCSPHIGHO2_01_FULL_49_22 TaxID=1798658 RepID=A0A1G2CV14_9BACT|nr:MAG: hypothetical protein A2845_03015 [Candidatus Lloydbacteria bacterium RIFCSPHIGHO2_01_FULL_49_22]OGZ10410.1 MAG: hypothetical protein A3C14_02710 [Candidatus Lloydbacteria bacterium RIFCSPHIGHO2_02_FULL_50_18]